ncbi:MAG: helix-turn-helix transcriptional regulator, partial [Gammaproteobacteria bacterium]
MNSTSLKIHNDQKITLSQNLYILLEIHNVNLSQMAQTLDIPVMTIRRLLSGETADPRVSTLKLIADYFNISIDSLIQSNEKFIKLSRKKSTPLFLPILDWETAQKITTIHELDLTKWKSWQP